MKSCNQCGKCCINYSDGGLVATQKEIDYWASDKPEISRYVSQGNIWMDPETGKQLTLCPWLKQSEKTKKYSCDIYLDRPEDCRHYPVTIAEMVRDDCEMIEIHDLTNHKRAQRQLDRLMADSRPGVS